MSKSKEPTHLYVGLANKDLYKKKVALLEERESPFRSQREPRFPNRTKGRWFLVQATDGTTDTVPEMALEELM